MLMNAIEDAFNQTEAGRQQGGKGTGLGLALVRQIVKLSGGRLGVSSKVGQGSTFWVELRMSSPLFYWASLMTALLALGVGVSALSILPKEQRPTLEDLGPQQPVPLPPLPPTPETEAQHKSGTVLEQTTSPDGLVQLMPRKLKAGEAGEHNGGCKGPGLFAPNIIIPSIAGEDDEDRSSRSGTSSGPPSASVLNPGSILVSTPETPTTPPQQQGTQPEHSGKIQETKSQKLVTRPTHVDLPPPPELKTLRSPQKTPSPSANRLPQIDISPGLQVLVVDDDKMTRMLFQRMLGRLNCSVTTAVNGYEALQLITGDQDVSQTPGEEEHEHSFSYGEDHVSIVEGEKEKEKEEKESRFAIVFLDNQMPVMSGVQMVRKLRKLGKNDLVVGVTGENFPPFSYPAR